jgi:hypothetical protein
MYKKEAYYVVLGGASLIIFEWLKKRLLSTLLQGTVTKQEFSRSDEY